MRKYVIAVGIAIGIFRMGFLQEQGVEFKEMVLKEDYETQQEAQDTERETLLMVQEDLQLEEDLNKIYQDLEKRLCIREDSKGVKHYQEYYGGAYIAQGKLRVCVTDDKYADELEKEISKKELVEFEKVTYSYQQLNDAMREFYTMYRKFQKEYEDADTEERDLLSSIRGAGIVQKKNGIEIYVENLTEEKEEAFSRMFGEQGNIHLINRVGDWEE